MPKKTKKPKDYLERKKKAIYKKINIWQDRTARLVLILMLSVQPLYFNAQRYYGLTRHKYVFFIACMCVVMLFVIGIWIARMTRDPRLLPEGKLKIVDWAVLGFAAVTLISAIFSPYQGGPLPPGLEGTMNVWVGVPERYDGAITQLLYVVIYFIVSRWYKPRIRDFVVFGISASIIALIGIFQFYDMDFFGLWPYDDPRYAGHTSFTIFFRSTLGNINIVSTYVCVAILLSGFLYVKCRPLSGEGAGMKGRLVRGLWLAASALNFWLMDLAGAESGRVGVIVAMLLAVPLIVENRKSLGRTLVLASSWAAVYALQKFIYDVQILDARTAGSLLPFIAAAAVLLPAGIFLDRWGKERDADSPAKWKLGVILVAICIVAGITGVEVLGRQSPQEGGVRFVYQAREMMHGNVDDRFGSGRIHIWRNAVESIPNYPVIGSGPDTFFNAFPAEEHLRFGRNYDKAHNEYLQILICQGILGLAFYLAFLGGLLLKSIPKAFKNPLVAAALVAFIGYGGQAFFNISLPIASQMLWVLAGMLASDQVRDATMREMS